MPFKDIFVSLFFVSVGMLVDVSFITHNPGPVAVTAAAVIVLKAVAAGGAALVLGYPARTAIVAGLALSQVGEFSFVLAKVGVNASLISAETYQLFLAGSVITMAVTPWLIQAGPALAALVQARPEPAKEPAADNHADISDHLIIVGFGPGGQRIAHAARRAGIPYLVLEMNIDTVRREKRAGEPIRYGDAAYAAVLEHANINRARVLVVAVSDPPATRRVVATARTLNRRVRLIVRTRFLSEVQDLLDLGASDVVPEEFETSIEIFTRVLVDYLVPNQLIERFIAEARGENYRVLRTVSAPLDGQKLLTPHLSGMDLAVFELEEHAPLAGKTLEDSGMRREHALTVVAVDRAGEMFLNPDGGFAMASGDKVYVFGAQDDVAGKSWLFKTA